MKNSQLHGVLYIIIFTFILSTVFFFIAYRTSGNDLYDTHANFINSYDALERLVSQVPDGKLRFNRDQLAHIFGIDTSELFIVSDITNAFTRGNLRFEFDDTGLLLDVIVLPERTSEKMIEEYYADGDNRINSFDHFKNMVYIEKELIFEFTRGFMVMWLTIPLIILTLIIIIYFIILEFRKKEHKKFNRILFLLFLNIAACFLFMYYYFYYVKIMIESYVQSIGFFDAIIVFAGYDLTLIFPTYLLHIFIINFALIFLVRYRQKKH